MNVFIGICWFISYLSLWFMFIYFGWIWAHEVQSAQAMAFWLFMSIVLGALGGYLTLRIAKDITEPPTLPR